MSAAYYLLATLAPANSIYDPYAKERAAVPGLCHSTQADAESISLSLLGLSQGLLGIALRYAPLAE